MTRYRTIVADPPWPLKAGGGHTRGYPRPDDRVGGLREPEEGVHPSDASTSSRGEPVGNAGSPSGSLSPLTPEERQSVQDDLDEQRRSLARHANTEPLTGRLADWSDRYWMLTQEIVRLEQILADDAFAFVEQGCVAAVLAGGDTWELFKAEAEQRMGLPWMEIKVLVDDRYANRTAAA